MAVVSVTLATMFANQAGGDSHHLSEAELLRRFGFAECLANGYAKTQFGSDAEWVADLYRQLGRESRGEVYEQISRAAEAIDAGKPAVVDNRNLAIFACMDFYEGAQLKEMIRKATAIRKR
jgi:hypothetical protein